MSQIRIAMVTPFPDISRKDEGSLIYISQLSKSLAGVKDVDLKIITLSEESGRWDSDGMHFTAIKRMKWYRYFPLLPALLLAIRIRKMRPEVLNFQGTTISPYLICGLFLSPSRIPKVMTIHGHAIEEMVARGRIKKHSILWKMQSWADRMAMERFEGITCVTGKMKDEIISKYGSRIGSKVKVVPSGIDTARFNQGIAVSADSVSKFVGIDERPVVLNAKALVVWNGQECIIRAFAEVVKKWPNARLLLVGAGSDRPKLEKLTRELALTERVTFTGSISNELMPALISRSDVIVVSSLRLCGVEEGSSIFLLEGMACGKPVVATDVGGNPEAIVNGETGIIVQERNPAAMSSAICNLVENPGFAKKIGNAAREFISSKRTWNQIALSYIDFYRELIFAKNQKSE